MNKRLRLLLATLLVCPAAGAAAEPTASSDSACQGDDKRICYETLAAHGDYQGIIDRISLNVIGYEPIEKYFLGRAHFGLSNRTAAHSLRCFHTLRAKDLLEAFLTERNHKFETQQTFGTSDEMRYVYHATKTMDALKSITGCEESSHTATSLERYARRYAIERIQGLVYNTETDGALGPLFREKMGSFQQMMQSLVTTASQVETRYRAASIELDAGRTQLFSIRDDINAQFGAGTVITDDSSDTTFPLFRYDQNKKQAILTGLDARYQGLLQVETRVTALETQLLGALAAQSMDDYLQKKEQTILQVKKLSAELLLGVNLWTRFWASEEKGFAKLKTAAAAEGNSMLFTHATRIDTDWRTKMKVHCSASNPAWYCTGGTNP
ncbi:hypothetical protein [Archangium lipolyticum]|uniref:hypothetical protein n=1 Tax=Archangium lipolyticum TaxID=2970465 RepID=UPI002149C39E|nr:hypothetical protein [Archangium lipolyticum]